MFSSSVVSVRLRSLTCLFLLGTWILTSIAALVAMYHLWWGRERLLYLGKPTAVQREAVFRKAGLPPILHEIERINNTWPLQMSYALEASNVDRSYLVYLLSPRIPSHEGVNRIRVAGGEIHVEDSGIERDLSKEDPYPPLRPSFRSLWLSVLLVFGSTLLIQRIIGLRISRLPELFALALFGLTLLTITARIMTGSSDPAMWLMTALGLTGWLTAFFRVSGKHRTLPAFYGVGTLFSGDIKMRLVIGLCAVLLVAGCFWSLLMACSVVPDDWDAWATWGPKAKYLAMGKGPMINLTSLGLSDYPLLWPSTWAFAGWLAGGWEEHWSKAWGAVFLLLTAWEIGVSVQRQTDLPPYAWICTAAFVTIPCVPLIASWAYAESVFWLMLACSTSTLLRWRDGNALSDLLLAGIFAAAACHAKNEGLVFCLLTVFWVAINDRSHCHKNVALFILPGAVVYGPWVWWTKLHLGLVSATTQNIHFDAVTLKWVISRIPDGVIKVVAIWMDVRQWNIVLFLLLCFSVYAFFRGGNRVRSDLMIPGGMLICFFVLDLFYDGPINWVLGTNWNRLTIQVVPITIMLIAPFLFATTRFNPARTASR